MKTSKKLAYGLLALIVVAAVHAANQPHAPSVQEPAPAPAVVRSESHRVSLLAQAVKEVQPVSDKASAASEHAFNVRERDEAGKRLAQATGMNRAELAQVKATSEKQAPIAEDPTVVCVVWAARTMANASDTIPSLQPKQLDAIQDLAMYTCLAKNSREELNR